VTSTPTAACNRCGARYPDARLAVCPRCLLEAEVAPAMLGESLELIEEIGRGGMGTVWKGRQVRLGRTVAIKFLAAGLGDDPEFTRRFEREAQALARLSHPRIVGVYDFGRDEGRPFIVMEYVDGRPLSELLPLPVERARAVALDVLEALDYAHAAGVIHRDVKPQNVMIDSAGRAKVGDFGIARLIGPEPGALVLTATGGVVGTPAYMPPEALAGAPPDPRTDVYAVGVLLHEMVTGRRPAGRASGLAPGLARVVERAIAADPRDRYASAAAMKMDLLAAGANAGVEEGRLPPEERPWLRAVALVQALATAAVLWAFLLSVTPRILAPSDVQPLIMLRTDALPDGRIVSRGRFETWPTLAAAAAVVAAIVAQALLRRHWREAGLERPVPDRAVPESTAVLVVGAVAVTLYALRTLSGAAGSFWTAYVPIAGGLLELGIVFLAWMAVLQAWRVSRPLHREVRLWLGLALALVPPVLDLGRYLRAWQP
jgi:eukaryotic-like serine/threonine-protein kinase